VDDGNIARPCNVIRFAFSRCLALSAWRRLQGGGSFPPPPPSLRARLVPTGRARFFSRRAAIRADKGASCPPKRSEGGCAMPAATINNRSGGHAFALPALPARSPRPEERGVAARLEGRGESLIATCENRKIHSLSAMRRCWLRPLTNYADSPPIDAPRGAACHPRASSRPVGGRRLSWPHRVAEPAQPPRRASVG
jgi:hypothetical protein